MFSAILVITSISICNFVCTWPLFPEANAENFHLPEQPATPVGNSQPVLKYAYVYNDSGMTLNYDVEWSACAVSRLKTQENGTRAIIGCRDAKWAHLRLKWKGYRAVYFDFNSLSTSEVCEDSNSLTIGKTAFGYKWNVYAGKGW